MAQPEEKKPTDRLSRLAQLALDGNEDALTELYCYYSPKLKALAYSYLRNKEESEDIVQDSFLKTIQMLPQIRKSLKSYLDTVVRNACFNAIAKNRRQRNKTDEDNTLQIASLSAEIFDVPILIERIISILSDMEQVVFLMVINGYKPKDIAKEMDKSPGNIRVTLFNARKKIKEDPIICNYYE